MGSKAVSSDWVRLARAAVDVRSDLRVLVAKCTAALEGGADPAGTLRWAREMAGQDATVITAALKARQPRQNGQNAASAPLWAVAGAGQGKRHQRARGRHLGPI